MTMSSLSPAQPDGLPNVRDLSEWIDDSAWERRQIHAPRCDRVTRDMARWLYASGFTFGRIEAQLGLKPREAEHMAEYHGWHRGTPRSGCDRR